MLVKLESVSKIYQLDGVQVQALRNVSITIDKGEFVALMGPSGSGKSTLMHVIGLLDTPTEGKVFFKDQNTSKMRGAKRAQLRNESIGFVFQQFNLLQRISSLENVILPLLYDKKPNKNIKSIGFEQLKVVGLEERVDHHPNQLSGGQQQRVAIARALINNPELVLADEPTGNLDTKTGKQIMQILNNLNKEGRTIVVVTHEAVIAKYAKRVINIVDGQIQ